MEYKSDNQKAMDLANEIIGKVDNLFDKDIWPAIRDFLDTIRSESTSIINYIGDTKL